MAHEIYVTAAGKQSMAFVGATPWHGLGQRLTVGASLDTWRVEAGLDWAAETAEVVFTRADGTVAKVDDKRVIYRTDTGAPLSVMGDGYKIVQPAECLEFFRDLTESGGWHIHTAGTLDGGRKIWAMASRTDVAGEVVPGDRVKGNLLLATSLDGSSATVCGLTHVRVVCANTLGQSLRGKMRGGASSRGVRVSHKSVFDAAAVRAQIDAATGLFSESMELMRRLAARNITTDQARDLLRELFGQPKVKASAAAAAAAAEAAAAEVIAKAQSQAGTDDLSALLSKPLRARADETESATDARKMTAALIGGEVREQKSVARCLELFAGAGRGANHPGVAGTRWGLLNAVTEHIDHEQGRAGGTRLESAWFGRGADFKAQALELLTA